MGRAREVIRWVAGQGILESLGELDTTGPKKWLPPWTACNPTRSFSDPILPFLDDFLEGDV